MEVVKVNPGLKLESMGDTEMEFGEIAVAPVIGASIVNALTVLLPNMHPSAPSPTYVESEAGMHNGAAVANVDNAANPATITSFVIVSP